MNLASPLDTLGVFKTTTRGRWDWLTPLAILALSGFGIAFIYSAQLSVHGSDWVKQVVFLGLGALVYAGVAMIDYRFWLGIAHWIYFLAMVPLVLVLVPGIGSEVYGSQRWINLGFFSFQPSETAKVAVLLITASTLIRNEIGTIQQSLGVLGKLALAVGLPMLLVLLQPDLKSAIVLPPMVFSMLYVSKLSVRFYAAALGAFVLLVSIVAWDSYNYVRFMDSHGYFNVERKNRSIKYEDISWVPLHDYQRDRILAFAAPEKVDPSGTGITYNRTQSLISVGSGGLTGRGWQEGTQAQLGYLPRSIAHNDFIFSVISEELGFLGSITVLGLFGLVLFNGIRIAGLARDRFGTLLALGVTVLFLVHVFVNIAMTIGLVPITGIPLPFISYGGSFVLSCCLLQGLVQSVYRFRKDFA
jgi:rod shape determining protein RodA